jgi:hypothetical protein
VLQLRYILMMIYNKHAHHEPVTHAHIVSQPANKNGGRRDHTRRGAAAGKKHKELTMVAAEDTQRDGYHGGRREKHKEIHMAGSQRQRQEPAMAAVVNKQRAGQDGRRAK